MAFNTILHAATVTNTVLATTELQQLHQESKEWQARITKIRTKLSNTHQKLIQQLAKAKKKERIARLREIFRRVDSSLKNEVNYLKRHIKFHQQDLNHIHNRDWSYDEYVVMTNHQTLKTKFNYLTLKSNAIYQDFIQYVR